MVDIYDNNTNNEIQNEFSMSQNIIRFDLRGISKDQRKVINNYKKELAKEALYMEDNCIVRVDQKFLEALNNEQFIELDMNRLNSKQRFLVTNCLKEFEKLSNPKIYEARVKLETRKKNNECAAKFRKKRKQFEIKNDVVRKHIDELVKDLIESNVDLDLYKKELADNKLANILSCLENQRKKKRKTQSNSTSVQIRPTPIQQQQQQKQKVQINESVNNSELYISEQNNKQQIPKESAKHIPASTTIDMNSIQLLQSATQMPVFVTLPNTYPQLFVMSYLDTIPYLYNNNNNNKN